jgi:hypothetical protein
MTHAIFFSPDGNPFASHRTRPGAMPFWFPAGVSAESLADDLAAHQFRGQIVGPHGSGKSTLLATLLTELHRRGLQTHAIALHDGQRRLPDGFLNRTDLDARLVIIVDGYEQLAFLERAKLRWRCWRRGTGLLITTHAAAFRFPKLLTLRPCHGLAASLFNRLMSGFQPLVAEHAAVASFSRHNGNLREVWFDLYDQYERNRRQIVANPSSLAMDS